MSTTPSPHTEAITGWRHWGAYVALVLVFAIACGLLSWWQWARRDEAVQEITRVEMNYDAEAVPVSDVLTSLDDWHADDEWTPVTLQGEYLVAEQVLVRNRVRGGNPGFLVLVPFRAADGTVLVIDRGWLPVANTPDSTPETVPAPPSGVVTVEARLRPTEPNLPGRSAPEGQIPSIDIPTLVQSMGVEGYTRAYGVLRSEDPAPSEVPFEAIRPDEDEGPHMSYALQWIAFGILAFFGLWWAWRREIRISRLPLNEQAAAREPKRQHEDADAEDAILDARDR